MTNPYEMPMRTDEQIEKDNLEFQRLILLMNTNNNAQIIPLPTRPVD